mmetsp:Transcript_11443/g.26919  ORF Transcript_11443/g.26919 Transcript_11443/m.26919 type:complete len:529 (-) Transcript_11443:2266-3852(-)
MVEAWVHQEPPEEVGPGEVLDGVLLGLDGSAAHFGHEVVVQHIPKVRLHGERLVEELLVEVLLGRVHKDAAHALVVELRSTRAPHHLEDVCDGEVDVSALLAVEELGALDHHEAGREVHAPRQSRRAHQHLDSAVDKELLDGVSVVVAEAGVVQSHPVHQRVLQGGVFAGGRHRLHLLLPDSPQELFGLVRGGAEADEVERGEAGLAPAGDEDEDGVLGRVLEDGAVRGLVHRGHPWAVVRPGEATDVYLHGHGPHRRPEVVHAPPGPGVDAQPVGEVVGVGQGGGEAEEAHALLHLGAHVTHAAHNHLQHGPPVLSEEVDLVDDHETHAAHVVSIPPPASHAIPFLRSRDDHIRTPEGVGVGRDVARELHHGEAEPAAQLGFPVLEPLPGERLERGDVHRRAVLPLLGLPWVGVLGRPQVEHSKNRQFGHQSLSRAGGGAEEDVSVRMVQRVEDLGLHRVEVRQSLGQVDGLEARVAQGPHPERRQVQQVRMRGVDLGEHQMLEAHGVHLIESAPAVAPHMDVILRR